MAKGDLKIRSAGKNDFEAMMEIAKKLNPKWFDNFAIQKSIPKDLKTFKSLVVEEGEKILGFLAYSSKGGRTEIKWMGVDPDFHRKHIGRKLFLALKKIFKQEGIKELAVETLAESTEYEPYEGTRMFYKEMGFKAQSVKKVKSKDTGEELDIVTFSIKINKK